MILLDNHTSNTSPLNIVEKNLKEIQKKEKERKKKKKRREARITTFRSGLTNGRKGRRSFAVSPLVRSRI
jgi:hypothetical protein